MQSIDSLFNAISAPSRRSDLQSLAYCMLHWHTGALPWSGFTQPDKIAAEKQRWECFRHQCQHNTWTTHNLKMMRYFRYIGDVPALLRDCFRKRTVSSELAYFYFFNCNTELTCVDVAHVCLVCVCDHVGAFKMYVSAAMALQYTELPDYSALRDGLSHVLRQQGGSVEQPLSC